ncbi:eEF1A lysine and N-terminal methyltransferase homolog [Contarinia nasturtii]|uniref:eEF1A lysine and N-terminal methyltransferase homolog n=1 Tax=Contarinia nasturtii TaxID=265458 RepID=UPI0012D47C1B|nr:eEF1A lysine and N-terminal methyltransferase homolog [Contarinia nasturtii]
MNLLPKTREDFTQTEYWNSFFQKRGKKTFEWYGEYPELCHHLHKYIKSQEEILNVGCGNSKLCMDLYDVGYKNITNIDTSPLVVNQMLTRNKVIRPDLKFMQIDACDMKQFENGKFSAVLDKATLDAIYVDETDAVLKYVQTYWSEIDRVLRVGGRYIVVSLLQKHILEGLLKRFAVNNWMFRVVRCIEAEEKTAEDGDRSLPVFMVIVTKFQRLPSQILEVCMAGDKMIRMNSLEEIQEEVFSVQKSALVCSGLTRSNIADMKEVSIDLYEPANNKIPRYTIHILDQKPNRENGRYAAFIVPQGRETEWLFSTEPGRKKLLQSAKHDRLAIVSMHRGHIYKSWDDVKVELSGNIRNFSPNGLKNKQIPFLSLGSDVGLRETIFQGKSDLSGDFVVEEIKGDNKTFRRLIFLSNQFVIQSEALVKIVKGKNKKVEKQLVPTFLCCQHHLYMSLGLHFIKSMNGTKSKKNTNCAIIGLGGGGLCTFIHRILKDTNIIAVDIDPSMLKIATDYFGLVEDSRLKVVIDDGIKFLKKALKNGQSFKAILFDVDSKDPTVGMSCPPTQFLEQEVLDAVKSLIRDTGIFILNLVCRDEKLREKVLVDLRSTFSSVVSYKLVEDVNEILYCQNVAYDGKKWNDAMEKSAKHINELLQKEQNYSEIIEVQEFLDQIKI